MRLQSIASAAAISLAAILLGGGAHAAPLPAEAAAASGMDIIPVQTDCHRDVRRHYLPEVGRRIEHFHRGPRCRVELVEEDEEEDCHANAQAHRLPEYGRRPILHRHRGSNCRVIILEEDEDEDCHAEPERHSLPGYGRVWHRHVGRSCRVEILRERSGASGPGCIRVGPVTVCP